MIGKIVGHGKKARYYIDGKKVSKRTFKAAFPDQPIGDGSGLSCVKPVESIALACHPKRAKEFEEDATKRGVPTVFKPNGSPIIRSRRHQREYLKAYFGNSIVNRDEVS